MPLDDTSLRECSQPDAAIAIVQQRRERAAALWRQTPPARFFITRFRGPDFSCCTIACALGWLAEHAVDGWYWRYGLPHWRVQDELQRICKVLDDPFTTASHYFGVSRLDACVLFGCLPQSLVLFGRESAIDVTGADVASALLAMPITLQTAAMLAAFA